MPRRAKRTPDAPEAQSYRHPAATTPLRPDVGVQGRFKKTKPPATYRYDSSLSPALDWDGQNPARERGEALLAAIAAAAARLRTAGDDKQRQAALEAIEAAARGLRALGRPFLDWAGKAERLAFDVPTLPLFTHERLSTRGIIETLRGHRKEHQPTLFDLFGDPEHPIADQLLKAYEHRDRWVNRLVLGDNLAVMNSLLHYENLGGQVQMIYMDPPYGVKFGSNFQPFVRKRDVKHNDDADLTREPEMVQAYRDTWELGLHSYLTYLRDRLLLCRELLHPTGSVFVQISDENLHHVREVMDEVFGPENAVAIIVVKKTGGLGTKGIKQVADYLVWHAKQKDSVKYHALFDTKALGRGESTGERYDQLLSPDGKIRRPMTPEERENPGLVPTGWRAYQLTTLTSGAFRENTTVPFTFEGEIFHPGQNVCWKTTVEGLQRLAELGRIQKAGKTLRYVRFLDDFPCAEIANVWSDVAGAPDKLYVVQTSPTVLQRCILMTTDPGDLVVDPTCGSGTTAYVAEHWGRRWITIDVSRVPLALARQRLLTATYPWYELKEEDRGPAGGFVYQRKQNRRGEEVGGIVPHVTLKSIANNEPPAEEVLVDRPEADAKTTRVTGPFVVEAIMPPPAAWEDGGPPAEVPAGDADAGFPARMLEVLRKSPVLHLEGNRTVTLKNIRPPARSLVLSAEAVQDNGEPKPVAFAFGPENGPVGERLVHEALREAHIKGYAHLYVIGFEITPSARQLVEQSAAMGVPATYVQATPDLLMGDLLKTMRASQIFSVCGLPEIAVKELKAKGKGRNGAKRLQVTLLGLDVFDPVTMENEPRPGSDVPAWFLDTDYNGTVFHISQAFFPRTSAWDNLKKALRATHEESVWDHLAGTTSAPFEAGAHGRVAVKVIDDRGNELLVVKDLTEAEKGR